MNISAMPPIIDAALVKQLIDEHFPSGIRCKSDLSTSTVGTNEASGWEEPSPHGCLRRRVCIWDEQWNSMLVSKADRLDTEAA